MTPSWYPGIEAFCEHWSHAPTLQITFSALKREFADDNDACIDAAKALVEVACQIIIRNLDDPQNPLRPQESNPDLGKWLSTAVRLLHLGDVRDESFKKLVSQYNKLTTTLGDLRNRAGPLSHGKDGFIRSLTAHHRRAAVLAADAIVAYLHVAYLERDHEFTRTLEPYERFEQTNALIDEFIEIEAFTSEDGALELVYTLPNEDSFSLIAEPSRLLFAIDRDAYKQALAACREAALARSRTEEQDELECAP